MSLSISHKKIIFLVIACHILLSAFSQSRITGTYHPATRSFETTDTNYWIDFFKDGMARIVKDGYVGLIDSSGLIICGPKYDKIFDFKGSAARVGLNGKFGIIDKTGKEIHAPDIDRLQEFANGTAITYFHYPRLFNETGQEITLPFYHTLDDYKEGMARFQKDSSYGILDKKGTARILLTKQDFPDELIRGSWPGPAIRSLDKEQMHILVFSEGLAPITKKINGKQQYGYIDKEGKLIIPARYDEVTDFKNGYALVRKGKNRGVINNKGVMIIQPQYQLIIPAPHNLFIAYNQYKWGVINTNNKPVIPFRYDAVHHLFGTAFAVFDSKAKAVSYNSPEIKDTYHAKGAWGVMDTSKRMILDIKYDGIVPLHDQTGVASLIVNRHDLPTSLPRYGQREVCWIFDSTGLLSSQAYTFTTGGMGYGFDQGSQRAITGSLRFREMFTASASKYIPYQLSGSPGKYVYSNNRGEQVIKGMYDEAYPFVNGFAIVGKSTTNWQSYPSTNLSFFGGHYHPLFRAGQYGMIDQAGNEIIPMKYEKIEYHPPNAVKDFIPVCFNKKWGAINLRDQVIIPFEYDQVSLSSSGAIVRKDSIYQTQYGQAAKLKFGFIDFTGKEIIPLEYDNMYETETGTLYAEQKYKKFLLSKKGTVITSL